MASKTTETTVLEPNVIRFLVVPSPDTNDHEVKVFIDGEEFISRQWANMMGMDPDQLLSYRHLSAQEEPHEATVVRCGCGEVGCGSASVRISAQGDRVIWDDWQGDTGGRPTKPLIFDRNQYMKAVKDAIEDHSWETPDRTAARILASIVDHSILAENNLKYQWASGRIRHATLTVSLSGTEGCDHILVHLDWKEQSAEEIAREAARLLKTDPNQWPDIVWYGENCNPPFKGPAWDK